MRPTAVTALCCSADLLCFLVLFPRVSRLASSSSSSRFGRERSRKRQPRRELARGAAKEQHPSSSAALVPHGHGNKTCLSEGIFTLGESFGECRSDRKALLALSLPWDVGRRLDPSRLSSPNSYEHLWHLNPSRCPKSALPQINVHGDYFPATSFDKPRDMGGGRGQNQNHPSSLGCPLFHQRFCKASPNRLHADK